MTSTSATTGVVSNLVWRFVAGALAMLTFHQAAVGLFNAAGLYPVAPFQLAPTGPLRLPMIVSSAFWTGLWGIVFLLGFLPPMQRVMPGWAAGLLFGFVVPVVVLFFVVAPLRGQPLAFAQSWASMFRIALTHAFWGLGMVLIWRGIRDPTR
jgi:hypothetical protein